MTEMIERVALVLEPKCRAFGRGEMPMSVAREFAKAAIEAMRDPTKAMEDAADDLDDWGVPSDPGSGNASALAHWDVMIAVALGDTKK